MGIWYTVRQQVLKWQKNAQRISGLPWERPHPELRNEPPLDMSGVRVQNPFMASLIQTWSRGWPLKGLGPALQTYQVGAHFEALDEGVLRAVLKSFEHFFCHFKTCCRTQPSRGVVLHKSELYLVRFPRFPVGFVNPGNSGRFRLVGYTSCQPYPLIGNKYLKMTFI